LSTIKEYDQINILLYKAAISPRIDLVPIVPDPFFGRSAIASVLRGSGTEKVIGYCF